MFKRLLSLIIIFVIVLSGCAKKESSSKTVITKYDYYTELPGITQNIIVEIEKLKIKYPSFNYGVSLTKEAFLLDDGITVDGFADLLCQRLTELYGIRFVPKAYAWDDLMMGLEDKSIDFTGELTPTPERQKIYFMTNPIVQRDVKIFTNKNAEPIKKIAAERKIRCAFLLGSNTYNLVKDKWSIPYEPIFLTDQNIIASQLENGLLDAYVEESIEEEVFCDYDFIKIEGFYPLTYSPVSLTTTNPDLKPIIDVMQVYLSNGGAYELTQLYSQGMNEYKKYKLALSLTQEEKDYIKMHNSLDTAILVGAESDNYPSCFYNSRDDEFQGLAIDILDEVSELTDLVFKKGTDKNSIWPDILNDLENGKYAIVTDLIKTDSRADRFLWADTPFCSDYYALISKTDFPDINIHHIIFSKVGLLRNSAYTDVFLTWFPDYQSDATMYDTTNEAFAALEKGEIDLLMASQNCLLYFANYLEKSGYKVNIVFDYSSDSIFGFNKNERILCSIINKAQQYIDVYNISEYWKRKIFNYNSKMMDEAMPYLIFFVSFLIVGILVVFFLLIKNSMLNKYLAQNQVFLEAEVEKRTKELLEQDKMLWSVNNIAQGLLSFDESRNFDSLLRKCLKQIGEMVNQNRVYIWKNSINEENKLCCTQVYEWVSGAAPQQDNPDLEAVSYEDYLPNFFSMFITDSCLNSVVKNLSETEREVLEPQDIKTILVAPIKINNEPWGFIGIDNCETEELFSENEEQMLSMSGFLLASAIYKNEITQSLIEAREDAMLSSKAKTNFLANMSHEIRTPMNAISGMAEIIMRRNTDNVISEYVVGIKNACNNLLNIINDILDISKIESGKLEIFKSEYNLASLLNDAIGIARVRLGEKPIIFITDIDSKLPSLLYGDEIRIKQILINLLSNAIKFTESGHVKLIISGKIEKDYVIMHFEVEDTGPGIKKEALKRLFVDFERVNTTKNRSIEGTGLGLAISKRLCEMMNGSIHVESVYGKGSVFSADIPQTFTDYVPLAAVKEKKFILLYEPRELYYDSIRKTILNLDCHCVIAINQSELYENISQSTYDYVFTSSLFIRKVKNIIDKENSSAKPVAFANYGEYVNDPDIITTFLPVNCLQISDILNNATDIYQAQDDKKMAVRFTAPQAKVLVVDDNNVNITVAKGLLQPYQLSIDTAINGLEAVELIKKNQYDLVFMDHMMPIMDGIDATNAIRALEGDYFQKLPIIALTANAIVGTKEVFISEGMNDFLAKPIEINKLNQVLAKWLPSDKKLSYYEAEEIKDSEKSIEIIGVDTKKGIASVGGDYSNYINILSVFYEDGVKKCSSILRHFNGKDFSALKTEVHAIKSTSATIGAAKVSEKAKQLEYAAGSNDFAYIDENIDNFLSSLKELVDNIKPFIKKQPNESTLADTPQTMGDLNYLSDKLIELNDAIEFVNITDIEAVLRDLLAFTWKAEITDELYKIQDNIDIFDYDEAQEYLNKLRDLI